jgi:amino acid permease
MTRRSVTTAFLAVAAAVVLASLAAGPLAAQAEDLGRQTLGRPYWHVFISYAIGWVLILGWVVSIARRLRSVETRLQADQD